MTEYIIDLMAANHEVVIPNECFREEVVRCKDCRWLFRDDEENPKLPDGSDGLWCDVFLIDTIEDGFCAWAKRKE